MNSDNYPDAIDAELVGTYPALANAGGGYVWDDVLEYRVWCHPERGAPDLEDGSDYYFSFATYAEASASFDRTEGAEEPLALIRQIEYIDEPNPGDYRHVVKQRIAEWPVESLSRPRRTANTIPVFLISQRPKEPVRHPQGLSVIWRMRNSVASRHQLLPLIIDPPSPIGFALITFLGVGPMYVKIERVS